MVIINDKSKCSGCGACVQICPKKCIDFKSDSEGFLYPIVDKSQCIECNLCNKVCQYQTEATDRKPIDIYAAYNLNSDVRNESSSGGMFNALAEYIINKGGVVFGAAFDENWNVKHIAIEHKEDLYKIRGSKYLQSRTGDTYKECASFLKQNRWVLYTGTPCQILGLNNFLRKEYDKLITVDVVCHGVPSPKVWQIYLKEQVNGSIIKSISFRSKIKGWRNYSLIINTDDRTYTFPIEENVSSYMKGFLKDLYLRPSCYNCISKKFRSSSDISIADYWWIQNVAPEMDDNKGCSQVYINTKKGLDIFNSLNIYKKETFTEDEIKQAYMFSGAVSHSAKYNRKRDLFFKKMNEVEIIPLIEKLSAPTVKENIFITVRDIVRENRAILNFYKKHVKPLINKL